MADRRPGSVRLRTTFVAVVVVGLVLGVGGTVFVVLLRERLTNDLRTATRLRAADVASLIEAGAPPGDLAVDGGEDLLLQVLGPGNEVVASSPNLQGMPPIALLRPGASARVDVPVDDDPFLAVAAAAQAPGGRGRLTVVAARTLDSVDEPTGAVIQLLVVGLPLLLLLVGFTTWWVVGGALAPVEAIRREVEAITAAELKRRVTTPAGRDEIARLARTMNRMLDRLDRAQSEQRRFVSDASHELRSPVASIRQHAEVAVAHPDRTTVPDLARAVLADDLRIQDLVDDLLLLARADEGALELGRQPVDVDDIVFEEAHRLRAATTLQIDTSSVSAARVIGDAAALRRAVRNVADNAARHARRRVAFSLREHADSVVLRIEDDGPGIAPEDRDRVFERFVRLDDARARDTGGSGLGLAIVAEVVAAHGGTVEVEDSPIGGARMTFTFRDGSAGG